MRFIEEFSRDLHYSARMLLKRRGFASIAVITLALGIGANTAIFSLVRGVLLRPLPFSESERLIGIRESKVGEGHNNPMAWRTFAEIRDKAQTLESIAAYFNINPTIEQVEGTLSVQGAGVSHSYFKVWVCIRYWDVISRRKMTNRERHPRQYSATICGSSFMVVTEKL